MAITKKSTTAHNLNANTNPRNWSYKVLGLTTWTILGFCFIGIFAWPRLVLDFARLLAFYMLIRFIVVVIFHLIGLARIRRTEKNIRPELFHASKINRQHGIHHVIIIPNYNEPVDLLAHTLSSLAVQEGAAEHLTVVLAMEEREVDAHLKVGQLQAQFKGKFARLLASFHPADLPGESIGKGTNERWAMRTVRCELVEKFGLDAHNIIITISDSDSVIHPRYFAELTRQFANNPKRYHLIWQSPLFLDNNIWRTTPSIRLLTYLTNAVQDSELANPFSFTFPLSTYSISMQLLEEVDLWDPATIAEDVNIFLRCYFGKAGNLRVQPIFLPTKGNPVIGANFLEAWRIFYEQKIRHAWGGTEIGYLLQKWGTKPLAPFFSKLFRLLKLVHDHLLFSVTGVVVLIGTFLSIYLDGSPVITMPPTNDPILVAVVNGLSGVGMATFWFVERIRTARGNGSWKLSVMLAEIINWILFPILTLFLAAFPALQAQTVMLFGGSISFQRTPKSLDSRAGE